jgi:Bacterial protein of unknown function (DUF882)
MVSGRFGRFRRTLASTLVALFTLGAPCALNAAMAAPATAKAAAPTTPAKTKTKKSAASSTRPAKSPAPSAKESHADKPAKHVVEAPAKDTTTSTAKPQAKSATRVASASSDVKGAGGRKSKKVASRMPASKAKTAKKGESEAPRKPCFAAPVSLDRGGLEGEAFSLVDCKGKPLEEAREKLSLLARPWGTSRPKLPLVRKDKQRAVAKSKKPGSKAEVAVAVQEPVEIAPNIRLLDPGLLARIEAIAKRFPGKSLSLVSGYRPQSRGSLHQSARALDLRVNGVANEELVAFCKTLVDTGCGYYPNSSFVHVDVRTPGTGSVNWIDASGPGESPRYVTQWPPPPEPTPAENTSTPPVVPPANDIDDETPRGGHSAAHGEVRSEEPKEPKELKEGAADKPAAPTKEPAADKPAAPVKEPAAKEPVEEKAAPVKEHAADKPAAPAKEPAAVKRD